MKYFLVDVNRKHRSSTKAKQQKQVKKLIKDK